MQADCHYGYNPDFEHFIFSEDISSLSLTGFQGTFIGTPQVHKNKNIVICTNVLLGTPDSSRQRPSQSSEPRSLKIHSGLHVNPSLYAKQKQKCLSCLKKIIGDQKKHPLTQFCTALTRELMTNSCRKLDRFVFEFCHGITSESENIVCDFAKKIIEIDPQLSLSEEELLLKMSDICTQAFGKIGKQNAA